MLLLPLVIGCWVLTAEPGPTDLAADLASVARLTRPPLRSVVPLVKTEPETAEYAVEAAARSSWMFVLPTGPRTVRAIEIVPSPESAESWSQARLRLTWEDDDPDPIAVGFDLPLGLAFGRAEGERIIESPAIGTRGGAWVNRFPMPYRDRALLRIDTRSPLVGLIRIRTTRGTDPDAGYFRGTLWTDPDRLAATGQGHLVGLFLRSEGRSAIETGRLSIDGKPMGSLAFAFGPETVRNGGLPSRTATAPPSTAYHWRIGEPIAFLHSFSVDPAPGRPEVVDDGRGLAVAPAHSSSAAVFWYSREPGPGRRVR